MCTSRACNLAERADFEGGERNRRLKQPHGSLCSNKKALSNTNATSARAFSAFSCAVSLVRCRGGVALCLITQRKPAARVLQRGLAKPTYRPPADSKTILPVTCIGAFEHTCRVYSSAAPCQCAAGRIDSTWHSSRRPQLGPPHLAQQLHAAPPTPAPSAPCAMQYAKNSLHAMLPLPSVSTASNSSSCVGPPCPSGSTYSYSSSCA